MIATPEHAPKITGMLIDLPINDITGFLVDWNNFHHKVQEALVLVSSS
jgi:hypothetical protein